MTLVVKRCGVKFSPPAIVVVYEENEKKKLRKCVMPIRNFRISSSVEFVSQDLRTRHKVLGFVSSLTVAKMLRIIQENMKGKSLDEALDIVKKEFTVDSDEDLNKYNDELLKRKKQIMDEVFEKNCIKPEDSNFVYDKRVDFEGNANEKSESGWDNEDGDVGDDFWTVTPR